MKNKQPLKFAVGLLLLCSLGSCSIGYEVDVSLKGGHLVFSFNRSGWFGSRSPAPIQHVFVRELSSAPHVVWHLQSIDYNGRAISELPYASVPSGMKQDAPPQPLKMGQYYRVELLALGGGGYKEFVISPEPENGQTDDVVVVRP